MSREGKENPRLTGLFREHIKRWFWTPARKVVVEINREPKLGFQTEEHPEEHIQKQKSTKAERWTDCSAEELSRKQWEMKLARRSLSVECQRNDALC